jgi:hypothetical protein
MPFFGFFGSKRLEISHSNADFLLDGIANDIDFTRKGSGMTTISGSVGHGVNLNIHESSSLLIRGNIGSGCKIFKEGSGDLTIEGTVADNLKLTVYSQATVTFRHRPPDSVITAINNRGGAPIYCEGIALPLPRQEYLHNHGAAAPASVRQLIPPVQRDIAALAPAPLPRQPRAEVDQYSDITQEYIDAWKAHKTKTVTARIQELKLSEEEKQFFEDFTDPITLDYFNDIPVWYNEKYYDLSTIEREYERTKRDFYDRTKPLRLAMIQPARQLLNNLDKAIIQLTKMREAAIQEAAKKAAAAQSVRGDEQPGLDDEQPGLTP